jgi:hypothetical protein
MRQLIRNAGLSFEELQPDHAARKFFDTMLVNSEVDGKFKELMMGHSVGLDEFYYDKNNEESRKKIKFIVWIHYSHGFVYTSQQVKKSVQIRHIGICLLGHSLISTLLPHQDYRVILVGALLN